MEIEKCLQEANTENRFYELLLTKNLLKNNHEILLCKICKNQAKNNNSKKRKRNLPPFYTLATTKTISSNTTTLKEKRKKIKQGKLKDCKKIKKKKKDRNTGLSNVTYNTKGNKHKEVRPPPTENGHQKGLKALSTHLMRAETNKHIFQDSLKHDIEHQSTSHEIKTKYVPLKTDKDYNDISCIHAKNAN